MAVLSAHENTALIIACARLATMPVDTFAISLRPAIILRRFISTTNSRPRLSLRWQLYWFRSFFHDRFFTFEWRSSQSLNSVSKISPWTLAAAMAAWRSIFGSVPLTRSAVCISRAFSPTSLKLIPLASFVIVIQR